jgi:hypothetical protein
VGHEVHQAPEQGEEATTASRQQANKHTPAQLEDAAMAATQYAAATNHANPQQNAHLLQSNQGMQQGAQSVKAAKVQQQLTTEKTQAPAPLHQQTQAVPHATSRTLPETHAHNCKHAEEYGARQQAIEQATKASAFRSAHYQQAAAM